MPQTYAELRRAVELTMVRGQREVDQARVRFTESLVAAAAAVTICTTKPDKYDRYLADVFLEQAGEPVFLNNALLAAGHATLKKEWEFSDWDG